MIWHNGRHAVTRARIVQPLGNPAVAALLTACGQYAPALVLIDMCAQNSRELLPQLVRDYPALLVIVVDLLGVY